MRSLHNTMKKTILGLIMLMGVLPGLALADGALITPPDYYSYETMQKAALFYESATSTETMVIQIEYSGNAKDFAWIVPTPNQPQVEKGSATLFTNLQTLTGGYTYPVYDSYTSGLEEVAPQDKSVSVLEQKSVDYYDISVLSATDGKALTKWLAENGYTYPEQYTYVFNDYINNGWYFTAVKLIPEVLDNYNITSALYNGTATPLQFTFQADNLVYPLKISQVQSAAAANYSYYQNIYLYIITDHKQEVPGFSATYADKIESKDIEDLAMDTQGNPWVTGQKNKYYLTALYSNYTVANMTDDLFPQDADKDTAINSKYSLTTEHQTMLVVFSLLFSVIGFIAVLISPFGLFFVIYTIVFFLARNLKVKIVFVVLQVLDLLITAGCFLASGLTIYLSFKDIFDHLEYSTYIDDEIFMACACIALAANFGLYFIVKFIILLVEKKKYKKFK